MAKVRRCFGRVVDAVGSVAVRVSLAAVDTAEVAAGGGGGEGGGGEREKWENVQVTLKKKEGTEHFTYVKGAVLVASF